MHLSGQTRRSSFSTRFNGVFLYQWQMKTGPENLLISYVLPFPAMGGV